MTQAIAALRLQQEQLKKNILGLGGKCFHNGLACSELLSELYVSEQQDYRKPHSRDDCYIVFRGAGQSEMGAEIIPFESSDFLFFCWPIASVFGFRYSLEAWFMFYGLEVGSK